MYEVVNQCRQYRRQIDAAGASPGTATDEQVRAWRVALAQAYDDVSRRHREFNKNGSPVHVWALTDRPVGERIYPLPPHVELPAALNNRRQDGDVVGGGGGATIVNLPPAPPTVVVPSAPGGVVVPAGGHEDVLSLLRSMISSIDTVAEQQLEMVGLLVRGLASAVDKQQGREGGEEDGGAAE